MEPTALKSDSRSTIAPLASVIVLNWNGGKLLARAVASVLGQDITDLEVIVVDNDSVDGSMDDLPDDPRIRTIRNGSNVGYAAGMNIGVEQAHGRYLVPMNCDAVLHPSFVREAVGVFQRNPRVGIVAPLVLRTANDLPPWSAEAGDKVPVVGAAMDLTPYMSVIIGKDLSAARECLKSNGACPVVRGEVATELHATYGYALFDEWFVTYGEDVDFAFKTQALGWVTLFQPSVVAAHVHSYASNPSVWRKEGQVRVYLLSSRYVNAIRHLRPTALVPGLLAVLLSDVLLTAGNAGRGAMGGFRDVRAAWARAFASIPAAWAFRRSNRTYRRVPRRLVRWTLRRGRNRTWPTGLPWQ